MCWSGCLEAHQEVMNVGTQSFGRQHLRSLIPGSAWGRRKSRTADDRECQLNAGCLCVRHCCAAEDCQVPSATYSVTASSSARFREAVRCASIRWALTQEAWQPGSWEAWEAGTCSSGGRGGEAE